MKNLWIAFQQSLKLPQKNAVFTLNRIGMDTTVFYLLILLAIVSLPELMNQIIADDTAGFNVHIMLYTYLFLYFLLFNVIINCLYRFIPLLLLILV